MKKKISTILFACILMFSLMLGMSACKEQESNRDNTPGVTITQIDDGESYDISKSYYESYDDSSLETYIITSIFNEPDIYIRELRELGYCEYVYENDEKMIEVKMTPEQRKAWSDTVEGIISDKLAEIEVEREHRITLSEDYKVLLAEVKKSGSIEDFGQDIVLLTYNVEIYQILSGEDEWSLNIVVKNADTGCELTNVSFPQEKFEISPEMWDE